MGHTTHTDTKITLYQGLKHRLFYRKFNSQYLLFRNEEIYEYMRSVHTIPTSPVRNMRHINPIRESGPLPAYDGPYTMEDIRKVMQ